MKATEPYFPVVLCIMLCKVVLTFESVDEILKCDHYFKVMKATKQCVIYVSYSFDTLYLQSTSIVISVTNLCDCDLVLFRSLLWTCLNKHGLGASLSTANTHTYCKVLSCVAIML